MVIPFRNECDRERQSFFYWFSILILSMFPATAMRGADLEAWIETDVQGQVLLVSPMVKAQGPQNVRYELLSKKTGSSGNSESRQAGRKSVACCEPQSLATLRLSVAPQDSYTLTLRVYVGSDLVAQDEIAYPPGREKEK